ncbi:pectinesterase family protein [Marasmitruncus massiliensis]|uniref:pectinesterase family protein n=1 Tax=Marasmitruncus massiliensis TaxID=1944642 RepID=UPI000C7A5144|nr:pectinesterase family protein [Marasmitruncus massiliensis]
MELTVAKDGSGSFRTIGEAIAEIPYEEPSVIYIRSGIYCEKLTCDKADIALIGENAKNTILSWGDGAYHRHSDGRPFGTFRSYTAFFGGGRVRAENLTIENTAGDGRVAGQAIAAYVDTRFAYFRNVRFLGRQDTLFAAPLPEAPRIPGSFIGPRENAPREPNTQYYLDCHIEGDVDFIFGGAHTVFEGCELVSLSRNEAVNGYIAAPCTPKRQAFGFLFYHCRLLSENCKPGTVFLGRPWREYGKAVFLECELGRHIAPSGWNNWDNPANEKTAVFAEYRNDGPGADSADRVLWRRTPDQDQARAYYDQIELVRRQCLSIPR